MPIYEFVCRWDGVVEILLPLSEWNSQHSQCPHCRRRVDRVPASVCTMRPDKYWPGVIDPDYGMVTSASQIKREMQKRNHVEVGDRADREGMDKIADRAKVEKEANIKKRVRGVMERAFGPSGAGLGGADGERLINEAK